MGYLKKADEQHFFRWMGMSVQDVIRLCQQEQSVHSYTVKGYFSGVAVHKPLITQMNAHLRLQWCKKHRCWSREVWRGKKKEAIFPRESSFITRIKQIWVCDVVSAHCWHGFTWFYLSLQRKRSPQINTNAFLTTFVLHNYPIYFVFLQVLLLHGISFLTFLLLDIILYVINKCRNLKCMVK